MLQRAPLPRQGCSLLRWRGHRLPIEVIVEPVVRLPEALLRLAATLVRSRPGLLLLDRLIRLHRADENSATEMAVVLDGLRDLARTTRTAILLVHHAHKAPSGGSPGAGLRGSSDWPPSGTPTSISAGSPTPPSS